MTTFFSITSVYDQLTDFANLSNFWSLFNTAFGSSYDSAKAATFKDQWQNQNFSQFPQIEIVSNDVLGTANGAYAISTNRIYLSDSFISSASQQSLTVVILEEFGHFVDAQINLTDSLGDEGAIFSSFVQGQSLNPQILQLLKAENDHTNIVVNGESLAIEQSTFTTTDLNTVTAAQLISTLLGSGVTVSNITFTGANIAGGIFSGGIGAGIGIESGIILSTGDIAFAQGPNDSNSQSGTNGLSGDIDLDNIVGSSSFDATVLEFDFVASSSTASLSYVFASEEYNEYVGSSFNDVFAFFLNGQNIALIPGTTTPVAINTVNEGDSSSSTFFVPNYFGTTTPYDTQFDGFTTVLSATVNNLVPGVVNTIKLAIADVGDSSLDSAVFIQAASFGNPTIVTVTATDSNAGEGTTPDLGVFTIARTGSIANSLTVNYNLSGTASSSDYNSIPATITIPAGQGSTTITVTPINDNLIEGNETVILSLTDTASYDLGPANSATVIIADNEAQNTVVNLSVAPASATENGTANLVYTFTRQGATTSPLTVNYNVGGTATFSTDYTQTGANNFSSTTGTITFATGSSTATLTIDPTGDTSIESDETVALTLASGTGYTIGTATTVTGTILDDDTPVITVAVNPTSVLEDGTVNLVYTFTRTGNTATALTVNYGVSGTATLNTDYVQTGAATFTSTSGSIVFAAGSNTSTLTINPTADTTIESAETVALTLAPNAGYTVGSTTAITGTIANDDLPSITLAIAPTSVLEDGTPNLVYTFTRTGATTSVLTVNYSIGGTATNGTDYTSIGTSVTFAVGSTTATVTIDPTADTTIEVNETVILTLASGTGYTIGTTTAVTGTITNDDLPSITLAVAPVSVLEDETTNLVYTFTRTGSATSALTVNYGITGTAAATDYTGATPGTGKTITFAPGSAIATLTIDPTADTTIEHNEIVILTLASGTGYTIGTTTAVTGTITNDDTTTTPTVTLALNYSGISENSPSNFIYTFKRTGSTTNALTVNYSIAGTATATDYIGATPGTGKTITFAANSATATLTIDPTADTTLETDETISLQLTTGTGYSIGTTNPQIATIINDDGTRRQKGTSGKDVILGTNLRDILSGDLGNDILTGSSGGDSFSFNALNEGVDTITDFSVGNDDLFVKGSGFGGGLVSGDIITATQFVIGTAATNTSQRFIYNATNGALLFDVDGSGATAASQFAILSPNLALTYEDIFVI